ncbi:MAG: endolytic transglycosylase MltG [Patescibacteria group bacterium]
MRIFLIIATIVTLSVFGMFSFVSYEAKFSYGSVMTNQSFEVRLGEDAFQVSARLKEQGIIRSSVAFLWHLVKEKDVHSLVAGTYEVSGSQSIAEIAHVLTQGKIQEAAQDIRVTFPEGWTARMMAERLTAQGLPGEEFRLIAEKPSAELRAEFDFLAGLPAKATLEGFLFPDTYLFAPDATADVIIHTLLRNFGTKVTPDLRNASKESGHTFFQVVTLASIIEEEGRSEEDRKMISDIFWKRIAIGQPLQSDATVNYILGTFKDQPTLKDLETNSPYNTYQNAGLPPGPISNPGLISLRAAIYPKDNPYFYFLNNPETRVTVFSRTFEEHKQNRVKNGL